MAGKRHRMVCLSIGYFVSSCFDLILRPVTFSDLALTTHKET